MLTDIASFVIMLLEVLYLPILTSVTIGLIISGVVFIFNRKCAFIVLLSAFSICYALLIAGQAMGRTFMLTESRWLSWFVAIVCFLPIASIPIMVFNTLKNKILKFIYFAFIIAISLLVPSMVNIICKDLPQLTREVFKQKDGRISYVEPNKFSYTIPKGWKLDQSLNGFDKMAINYSNTTTAPRIVVFESSYKGSLDGLTNVAINSLISEAKNKTFDITMSIISKEPFIISGGGNGIRVAFNMGLSQLNTRCYYYFFCGRNNFKYVVQCTGSQSDNHINEPLFDEAMKTFKVL